MPKQVDHAERRALIADAAIAVVARGGLEEASVRHVAAEAGVSVGMVQHYFRTKDELLLSAMERIGTRVTARMGAGAGRPPELLRTLFRQLLPLDAERAGEGRVALAFLARVAAHPETGAALRTDGEALRAHFAAQGGTVIDANLAVTGLLALLDGLGVAVLTGQLDTDTALATFDAYLELVYSTPG